MQSINIVAMEKLQEELREPFQKLTEIEIAIRDALIARTDGKNLKGNERVGWIGEIYIKLLFNGKLVSDTLEHDVETPCGKRISVKTRKGNAAGWHKTSAIPKISGVDCPTHLAFVHLNDDYAADKIWLYEWEKLCAAGRFKEHIVRGERRSYIFFVNKKNDQELLIYQNKA